MTEEEADSKAVSNYLNAITLGGNIYKPSLEELMVMNRTKRYNFISTKRYRWIDSITGEETVAYPADFSTYISNQILEVFKEDQTLTSIELLDKYVERYDNLEAVLYVMDSNMCELEEIRKGYKYPYLVNKMNMLFNTEYLKERIKYDDSLTRVFKKCNKPRGVTVERYNQIKDALSILIPTLARKEPYKVNEFKDILHRELGQGAHAALVKLAKEFCGCSDNIGKSNCLTHYLRPTYMHSVIRTYLDHYGIYLELAAKYGGMTKRERYLAMSNQLN